MSKWRLVWTIATLSLVLLLVGACAGSSKRGSTGPTTGATTEGPGRSITNGDARAPGVSDNTITVGLLTDITGAASSTFADTADGVRARFSLQNAEGGVHGRTIRLITADTGSTEAGADTAAHVLVSQKRAFGIIAVSAVAFGASDYLRQQGIPVAGSALDGPEWYTEPNTNMFNIEGTSSPHYPSYTAEGNFYRSIGVHHVAFVADNTPSSARGVKQVTNSIRSLGLQECTHIVVPLGNVDFTTTALAIKQAGCDAAECSCLLSSSLALAAALHDSGLHIPVVFDAGPAQEVLNSPDSIAAAAGNYFPALSAYSGAGYHTFISALKDYDSHYEGGLPDLGVLDGWLAADLFIQGLQVAGPNPTRQSFISQLRQVRTWSGNGLRPGPTSFSPFGQAPSQFCLFYLKFQNAQYQSYPPDGQPFCGTVIPDSDAS